VLDADGLNCLAKLADWPHLLPSQSVLTPHAAELGRLCQLPVADVLAARWPLARQKAQQWQTVVLAKGPYTVIADPQGRLAVLPIATSALATAGTGDVLAGIIAGLLAQGTPPWQAACLGAWLHGRAGEECTAAIGPAGVIASDLLARLPAVMNALREG
jgi:ADP-dependent NAD(P)H-hydrate dehydratase / NAD(P)H-hydrate epimerase